MNGTRYLLVLSILLSASLMQATRVPVQTAKQIASRMIAQRQTSGVLPGEAYSILSANQHMADGDTAFHIIRLSPEGFVIVAAEDNVYPVLAYSYTSDFPTEAMPEHIAAWMEGYAQQITWHRAHQTPASAEISGTWDMLLSNGNSDWKEGSRSVEPLLLSTWNQGSHYNGMCPQDVDGPGGRVYAGCVATAMGQVMYYYRYPQSGSGSSSYFHPDYGQLSANYGNTTYRWEEMLNSINTQNDAIAELLYQCGVAVEMGYSPTGSGAYSSDAASALRNFFGYSQSTQLVHKTSYTDQAWKALLMAQLDAGKPMYYHGYGSGGHAFNVDGYEGDDHFHFNWGWSGSYNGYFFLTDLNPGGSNFSNGQGAIINIEPAGTYPSFCTGVHTLTAPQGTFEDGSGPIAAYQANAACSWLIAPQQDPNDSITSISLNFNKFNTEDSIDVITVYAGSSNSGTLVGKYSGNTLPAKLSVEGNSMFVVFESNAATQGQGFYATYTSTVPEYCNKSPETFTDSAGTISDGSGQKDYNDRSICQWAIQPEGAEALVLTFSAFDTEPQHDFLEIYEYEPSTGNGTLIGKYSGNTLPPVMVSNTGAFFLIFVTNGNETRSGWEAHYSMSAVGMEENEVPAALIYPNPTRGILNIEWVSAERGSLQIELLDLTGRKLISSEVRESDQHASLDLGKLSSGQYLLRMVNASGVRVEKVVIK